MWRLGEYSISLFVCVFLFFYNCLFCSLYVFWRLEGFSVEMLYHNSDKLERGPMFSTGYLGGLDGILGFFFLLSFDLYILA